MPPWPLIPLINQLKYVGIKRLLDTAWKSASTKAKSSLAASSQRYLFTYVWMSWPKRIVVNILLKDIMQWLVSPLKLGWPRLPDCELDALHALPPSDDNLQDTPLAWKRKTGWSISQTKHFVPQHGSRLWRNWQRWGTAVETNWDWNGRWNLVGTGYAGRG